MSSLTQSHQVFFEHPLCLIPSTSHVIRLTQSLSSFPSTCPNHLNVLYLPTASSPVSEMTYTVSSGTLNSSTVYHTILRPAVSETGPPQLLEPECGTVCHQTETTGTVIRPVQAVTEDIYLNSETTAQCELF